jgi:hypothetical protein
MTTDVGHFETISWPGWYQVSSGYTGVWATENTRAAIFDAMMRKETYATTGARIEVRFFGGWDFVGSSAAGILWPRMRIPGYRLMPVTSRVCLWAVT